MTVMYFKTAIRNLSKHKIFTTINLVGLSCAVACCLLIAVYVNYELNYDHFQEKKERIARVIMEYNMGGSVNKGCYTSTKVGPTFKRNFPEVEEFVRMSLEKRTVNYNNNLFFEKRFLYADSTFLNVFSFKLLAGNAATALNGKNKLVITESMAKKYFGVEDAIGKIMKISSLEVPYEVTGIIEDCPDNSQVKYDFISTLSTLNALQEETYWNANYTTYFLLKTTRSIEHFQPKISGFMKQEMKGILSGNDYVTYFLEPFLNVHLYSPHTGFEPNSNIHYLIVIGCIGFLILIIACFTFINLSTARSLERAKETGIRKVAGASRKQLFLQFTGESLVLVFIAVCVGFLISLLCLPAFAQLMQRQLPTLQLFTWQIALLVIGLTAFVGFLAGSYPALMLSAYEPVKVLKGIFKHSRQGILARQSLFVFQFVISVFLIVSAIVIQKQIYFVRNKNLGFNRENTITFLADAKIREKYSAIKTEFKQLPGVLTMGSGDFEPCSIVGGYNMSRPDMLPDKSFSVFAESIDEDYLEACHIKLYKGSNISKQDVLNVSHQKNEKNFYQFIINKAAAIQLGWKPEEAVGKRLFLDETRPGIVKAVMEDFHFNSLHEPIKPLVLFPGNFARTIHIRLKNLQALEILEKKWKELMPHRPFEFNFLDETYDNLYRSELQLGKAVNVFTLVAVLLACLGLFGLSAYSIQQRRKEVSVLKVLGARVSHIVFRLSEQFVSLVVLAIFISLPIAFLVMRTWLTSFYYRISLHWLLFAIPALLALLLAFLTISIEAAKAAQQNPVKNLRSE